MMLRHVALQEKVVALNMVLVNAGFINPLLMSEAEVRAHSALEGLREEIERLGTGDPESFDQILKNFEGPLQ